MGVCHRRLSARGAEPAGPPGLRAIAAGFALVGIVAGTGVILSRAVPRWLARPTQDAELPESRFHMIIGSPAS
jgi:hypothetical protein